MWFDFLCTQFKLPPERNLIFRGWLVLKILTFDHLEFKYISGCLFVFFSPTGSWKLTVLQSSNLYLRIPLRSGFFETQHNQNKTALENFTSPLDHLHTTNLNFKERYFCVPKKIQATDKCF